MEDTLYYVQNYFCSSLRSALRTSRVISSKELALTSPSLVFNSGIEKDLLMQVGQQDQHPCMQCDLGPLVGCHLVSTLPNTPRSAHRVSMLRTSRKFSSGSLELNGVDYWHCWTNISARNTASEKRIRSRPQPQAPTTSGSLNGVRLRFPLSFTTCCKPGKTTTPPF